jgi:uncharacterized LabA/DUF88 family protein
MLSDFDSSVKTSARTGLASNCPGRRVMVYIDSFNLLYAIHSAGMSQFTWLDPARLARRWLRPDDSLVTVHFFSARLHENGGETLRQVDHDGYLEALSTLPEVMVHLGHFLGRRSRCPVCGQTFRRFEEKMTDVNIAIQMLHHAHTNQFDTAFLVSADSDLAPPVALIRSQFPDKRILLAMPPGRKCDDLDRVVDGAFHIGKSALRRSQLRNPVVRADGFHLWKPSRIAKGESISRDVRGEPDAPPNG